MPTQKLTPEIIHAAITGFESQKIRIDAQIAELRAMLPGGRTEPAATPEAPSGKPESPSKTLTAKPKRTMSAAGRKAISDATKKRWAAFHAAKKPGVVKKAAPMKTAAKKSAAKKAAKAPVKTETQPTA